MQTEIHRPLEHGCTGVNAFAWVRWAILLLVPLVTNTAFALNVTIIESQSFNAGHNMDLRWNAVLNDMGHTPSIQPQTTLDDIASLADADILIISSGVIDLTAIRVNTILQFLLSGRPVHIQSEYLSTYDTNEAFAQIVSDLGGSFNWTVPFAGDLVPMNVLGTYATTNEQVAFLYDFWYSFAGEGDCNIVPFLEYGGGNHGFQYIPTDASIGSISTTADQDWVRGNASPALMMNIITHLITPPPINAFLLDIGSDATICAGEVFVLDATTNNATYAWQDGSDLPTFTVTGPGTYWVEVSVNECIARDTVHVVGFNIAGQLGPDTLLCSVVAYLLEVDLPGAAFLWQDGSTSPDHSVESTGTYWVEVTIDGCTARDTVEVVFESTPEIDLGEDQTLCEGETLELLVTTGDAFYLWQDGSSGDTHQVTQGGMYWVMVTVRGCSAADSVQVELIEVPGIDLGNDTTLCEGASLLLDAQGPFLSYLWQDGSTDPGFLVGGEGEYWVQAMVDGCISSDTILIGHADLPVVGFSGSHMHCEGDLVRLDATTEGASYVWNDGSTASQLTVTGTGTYSVEVTVGTCTTLASVYVEIVDCEVALEMPNVFSPNNDQMNDQFLPITAHGLQQAVLAIYNRWGQLISENALGSGWDGKYRGGNCPDGSYIWQVRYTTRFNNEAIVLTGMVTLLR